MNYVPFIKGHSKSKVDISHTNKLLQGIGISLLHKMYPVLISLN